MRWTLMIIGIVLLLIGAVWTLQGLNILLGSPMSGQPFWMWAGIGCLLVGAALCFMAWRRRTS